MERETKVSGTLDLIFIKREESVHQVKVVDTLGGSDHVVLGFTILQKGNTVCSQSYGMDFRKSNSNKLKVKLGRIPLSEILEM